ncbi:MAG: hypothetical protein QF754_03365 [Alphaproteobacteria bacterium]|jgi:hypothetical protein|nr:hypothetical protein [Alphaproteobacteria bacterium]
MTNDAVTTAHPMSGARQRRLSALLDTVLPASEDGTMPSAGELDFPAYVLEQSEAFMPALARIVDHFDDEFPDQPLSARLALVEEYSRTDAQAFNGLLFHIYDCYYQDDRVRELIGVLPGAPFPQGNVVEPGDLSLLDAVLARPRSYRRAG